MRVFALCFTLLLGGCAAEYTAAVIEKKRQYSNTEGEVFRNAPCAMTVGSYWRILTSAERRAVDTLCGGEAVPIFNPETGLLEEAN